MRRCRAKLNPSKLRPASDSKQKSGLSKSANTKLREYPVLSIKKEGIDAYREKYGPPFTKGEMEYDRTRVAAYARSNEVFLMMQQAGLEEYFVSGRIFKQRLNENNPHDADAIKASRLAGVLLTEEGNIAVYNFGTRNKRIRPLAEKNIAEKLIFMRKNVITWDKELPPAMLILGEKDTAILNILNYDDSLRNKSAKDIPGIQQNFHTELFGEAFTRYYYLPITRDVLPLLYRLRKKGCFSISKALVENPPAPYCSCLSCDIWDYQNAKRRLVEGEQLEIHCYEWQVRILTEYLQTDSVKYQVYPILWQESDLE